MSQDGIVWECIGKRFCSFRVRTPTQNFCLNRYSITGVCERSLCPLANSQYATVLDVDGHVVLHMKVIERAHLPAEQWELIELSQDYKVAVKQLHRHLKYWPLHIRDNCRLRLKKIKEMHHRMHLLEQAINPRMTNVLKKVERREMKREAKALAAAQLEKNLQKELLAMLKEKKYEGVYNASPLAYKEALRQTAVEKHIDLEDLAFEDQEATRIAT